ncbi:MAG: hypothetical protein HKP61_10795, partial [Dactylosporangium sp.]|nr:hypothetical protein [Dactylosporangium sp.]NNJ61416.1 hypothetical protein [Dactylosporangium sp.]
LGLGQAEARRRYNQLAKADPHNLDAQDAFLQQLCPKWGGSFEAVHAFARACVDSAPPGAPNAGALLTGHFEHWLDLPDDDSGGYFRRPEVRQDLVTAAAKSVLDPNCVPGKSTTYCHEAFALAFSLMGEPALARPHFAAIADTCPAGTPWRWMHDPQRRFADYRAIALAAPSPGGVRA